MRLLVPASALTASLVALGTVLPAFPAAAAPMPAASAAPAAMAGRSTPSPDAGAPDAAARHAKRTACLKEAKAKKLLGADKNSYIKACVAGH